MIKYRELPAEEYNRLEGHDFLTMGVPPHDASAIVVAEEDGHIVGFSMLVFAAHLEPLWVHPDYRGGWVPYRLWERTKRLLDQFRINVAYCRSNTPDIAGYLTRLGLKALPGQLFVYDPGGQHKEL